MKRSIVAMLVFGYIVKLQANIEIFTAIKQSRPEYLKQLLNTYIGSDKLDDTPIKENIDLYISYSQDIVALRRAVLMNKPIKSLSTQLLETVNKDTIMGMSSLLLGGMSFYKNMNAEPVKSKNGAYVIGTMTRSFFSTNFLVTGLSLGMAYIFLSRAEKYRFERKPIRSYKQAHLESLEVEQILLQKKATLQENPKELSETVINKPQTVKIEHKTVSYEPQLNAHNS